MALWTAFCINPTCDTSQRSVDGDSSVTGAGRPRATWAYIITVSSTRGVEKNLHQHPQKRFVFVAVGANFFQRPLVQQSF